MREGTLRHYPFQRIGDGGGLYSTDPDGEVTGAGRLTQQHDRLVGGEFDANPNQLHGDPVRHGARLSPAL